MNKKQILILKTDAMSRMLSDHEIPTWKDFATLKKGTVLEVVVDGINTQHTHILVNFGNGYVIDGGKYVGLWLLPINCLTYINVVGQGILMDELELLQDEISVELLYDLTERFIEIRGYLLHQFSVKQEALEKMMLDEALIEQIKTHPATSDKLHDIPFAISVLLSMRSIPPIKQLHAMIKE